METRPFVLTPDQRQPALNVLGMQISILASNAATRSFGLTLQQGDEGLGPPPHRHDWDESFYVLGGEVEFLCAGEVQQCGPGTLVYVPSGTVHGFRYGRGGGQMLEITGRNALAAQMFTAVSNEIPPGPPDVEKLLEVLGRNGVSVAA